MERSRAVWWWLGVLICCGIAAGESQGLAEALPKRFWPELIAIVAMGAWVLYRRLHEQRHH